MPQRLPFRKINPHFYFWFLIIFLGSSLITSGDGQRGSVANQARSRLTYQINDLPKSPLAQRIINVRQKGVRGDGTTDDTALIQQLVTKVPPGTTLFFPPGTYLITKPILINRSKITLKGQKATIHFVNRVTKNYKVLQLKWQKPFFKKMAAAPFLIRGQVIPGYLQLKGAFKAGQRSFPATGLTTLQSGDLVYLLAPDSGALIPRARKTLAFFREQNFATTIRKVTSQRITLQEPVSISLQPNPRLFRVVPVKNVSISNFKIKINSHQGPTSGIICAYGQNCLFEKITISNHSKAGIEFLNAYKCVAQNNLIKKAVNLRSSRGWGIALDRSHFCLIKKNHITGQRHGLLLNHGNGNNLLEKNRLRHCHTGGAIDVHGEYNYYNVIRQNRITASKIGILLGGGGRVHYNDGPFNCLSNNQISDCRIGISIRNHTPQTILKNNHFRDIWSQNLLLTNLGKNAIINL